MNLDELTIGQAKQLADLFSGNHSGVSILEKRYIGKYVIVRSSNEGINAGYVVAADETGVILKDARRMYYHKPSDKSVSWYEGVAESGLSNDSKVSCPVAEKAIIEKYSITLCSDVAAESIRKHKAHETTN